MTIKAIPAALQADYDADVGTFCILMQVLAQDGTTLGVTQLDRTLAYEAADPIGDFTGLGVMDYLPDPGVDPTELEFANDLGVDGGDGMCLVPIDATPLTPEDIRAGKWNDAMFRLLKVNYEALDHGHEELIRGYWGNVTLRDKWLLVIQLDGLTRPLKQNLCPLTSKTCRAQFGTQEDEVVEPCGKDVTAMWVSFTVTSVDADDNQRAFTASALAGAGGTYFPGAVIWDTGNNAGVFSGVDSHETGGVVGLRTTMPRAIQVGDTGRIREDCTKEVEGDKGCRYHFGDDWVDHFKGEPFANKVVNAQVPGARVGPGNGGSTTSGVETAPE